MDMPKINFRPKSKIFKFQFFLFILTPGDEEGEDDEEDDEVGVRDFFLFYIKYII